MARKFNYSHKIKSSHNHLILWAEHEDAGPYCISRGYVGSVLAWFGERNPKAQVPCSPEQLKAFRQASYMFDTLSLFDKPSREEVKTIRNEAAKIR